MSLEAEASLKFREMRDEAYTHAEHATCCLYHNTFEFKVDDLTHIITNSQFTSAELVKQPSASSPRKSIFSCCGSSHRSSEGEIRVMFSGASVIKGDALKLAPLGSGQVFISTSNMSFLEELRRIGSAMSCTSEIKQKECFSQLTSRFITSPQTSLLARPTSMLDHTGLTDSLTSLLQEPAKPYTIEAPPTVPF